jgi:hypothetical protein
MPSISQSVGAWERGARNLRDDVIVVQTLLRAISRATGNGTLNPGTPDGRIARPSQRSRTFAAITAFEGSYLSVCNGLIEPGGATFRRLNEVAESLHVVPDAAFPPHPSFSSPGSAQRAEMFGTFQYEAAPTADNPEAIRILGNWERENIVRVPLPQLSQVTGGRHRSMQFHRLARQQLIDLWQDWETAGLLDRILSYNGSFVPRFIRGSTTRLSNHAFGSAFDINARWNPLRRIPPAIGEEGCVRDLVPTANRHGFYWGGHYNSRPDGMHFEIALLARTEGS